MRGVGGATRTRIHRRTAAAKVLSPQRRAGNRMVLRAVRTALTSNPFEDPAAFKDANSAAAAMTAYKKLPPASRRLAIFRVDRTKLARVLAALSPTDQVQTYRDELGEILRWVQEDATRASAGLTDEEIAGELKGYLVKQAEDAAAAEAARKAAVSGKAPASAPSAPKPSADEVKTELNKLVASTSIRPPGPSGWDAMSPADRAAWTAAGNDAVASVVEHARVERPELKLTASRFRLAFKDVESRGASVFAFGESDGAGGTRAAIGFGFVRAVKLDPAYVMHIVVHELAGHPEYGVYGTEYHLELYDAAMATMPGYVRPAAGTAERRKEIDAYAYAETEIYALLRSMRYLTHPRPEHAGKLPNLDVRAGVEHRVGLMKKQWPPKVIVPILRGFRTRLATDPRISGPALRVFDNAVLAKFDEATLAEVTK